MNQSWDEQYKNIWDDRYKDQAFTYGKAPGMFLKEWLQRFKAGIYWGEGLFSNSPF